MLTFNSATETRSTKLLQI